MAQRVLIVSNHDCWRHQKIGLQKVHGVTVDIQIKKKLRFCNGNKSFNQENYPSIIEFHERQLQDFDWIYYNIPGGLQLVLLGKGYSFRVLEKPKFESHCLLIRITERTLDNEPTEIYRNKFPLKGNKGYYRHQGIYHRGRGRS